MAIVTITGSDVSGGSPSGGGVGGASNLTTAGAVPYVASAGVLTEAATQLFWDSSNSRLGLGTNTPGYKLEVYGTQYIRDSVITLPSISANTKLIVADPDYANISIIGGNSFQSALNFGDTDSENVGIILYDHASNYMMFLTNGSERARITSGGNLLLGTTTDDAGRLKVTQTAGSTYIGLEHSGIQTWRHGITTDNTSTYVISNDDGGTAANKILSLTYLGNVLLGGVTSGGFRLDVQKSGASGTLRVYDQTVTTGISSLVVRAGAGQSTNNLQEWQNNAGSVVARIADDGLIQSTIRFLNSGAYDSTTDLYSYGSAVRLPNNAKITFSNSNSNYYTATSGFAQASSGVIEVNNGTVGTYRDILLRYLQNTGVTVATLPAAAAGNAGTQAYVTDASATTIGSVVAGGGANKVMVWSNGTNWLIYAS